MKIAVLAKYGFEASNLFVDSSRNTIDLDRSPKKISESDLNAVEEAVRIKSVLPGSKISIFSVAKADPSKALRELVAMGADRGYFISYGGSIRIDESATAYLLKKALEKLGPFDLILAGHASEDNYAGAVPQMIAHMLELPTLSYASKMKVENNMVTIERDLDGNRETIECETPALVTVTHELNKPRYATTLQVLRVPRDAVSQLKFEEDLGVSGQDLDRHVLRDQENLKLLTTSRKNVVFDGSDPKNAARELVEKLTMEGAFQIF